MKISRRQALTGMCSIAGTAMLSGCAINPVTGKPELMLMGEGKEIALGMQSHGEIINSYGSLDDDAIQGWFNERGQEMAKITQRSHLQYNFTVLDSPVVNAFAVPGGYVYVTRGILGYFNNEAQFAGVLGHELGHINYRHSAARYSKAQLTSLALGVGSVFSEEFAKYSQLASVGAALMFLKFSRSDEREADKAGVEYSSKIQYDATEISNFFHTLERMRPKEGSLPAWQSTHPDPGDRINATRKQAVKYQTSHPYTTGFVTKRDEYLELIDGLVFGDNPRQGYVKDNMFYHPEMKFMFPVFSNWELSNNPSEVRMTSEDQAAVLVFTLAPGATLEDSEAKFTKGNNVVVSDSKSVTINGMNGLRMSGIMEEDGSELFIQSNFIKKENTVFAFHGITAQEKAGKFESKFIHIANGFSTLTDSKLLDVSAVRLQVRQVKHTKKLKDVFNDFDVSEEKLEEFSIMNGMELEESVKAGTRIKIIA